jgi:hypothetical protein
LRTNLGATLAEPDESHRSKLPGGGQSFGRRPNANQIGVALDLQLIFSSVTIHTLHRIEIRT